MNTPLYIQQFREKFYTHKDPLGGIHRIEPTMQETEQFLTTHTSSILRSLVEGLPKEKQQVKRARIVRTIDIGIIAGKVFEQGKDGRWKSGIFSSSDEAMQEYLLDGIAVPIDADGNVDETFDPEIDTKTWNTLRADTLSLIKLKAKELGVEI